MNLTPNTRDPDGGRNSPSIFDRFLIPLQALFALAVALVAPVLLEAGYDAAPRYLLCGLFVGGALLLFSGYVRYWPWRREKVLMFLVLLGMKSWALLCMGAAFFFLAVTSSVPVHVTPGLLVAYAMFGMAGATMFFAGVYVFVGAGRGWLQREVYKNPFRRGRRDRG